MVEKSRFAYLGPNNTSQITSTTIENISNRMTPRKVKETGNQAKKVQTTIFPWHPSHGGQAA